MKLRQIQKKIEIKSSLTQKTAHDIRNRCSVPLTLNLLTLFQTFTRLHFTLKMTATLHYTRDHWIAHYDAMQPCFADIQMKQKNDLQTFFQWAADEARVRITRKLNDSAIFTQDMFLILPDYDEPENPDWDYECDLPSFACEFHSEFAVKPTSKLDVVTMELIITPEIATEIPRAHLPADFQFDFDSMMITITIPREQVTDIGF